MTAVPQAQTRPGVAADQPPRQGPQAFAPSTHWRAWHEHAICGVLAVFAMQLWSIRVTGGFSLITLALSVGVTLTWMGFGFAIARALSPHLDMPLGVPQQILIGFLSANTLAFFLVLLTPFGVKWHALTCLVLAALLAGFFLRKPGAPVCAASAWPSAITCLVSAIAATGWCNDSQPPYTYSGSSDILQLWADAFVHIRYIAMFETSHGVASLQDLRLAGHHAPVYHFGSYITPATISALGDISAVDAYASFQLPFGVFLTGLAAFALFAPLFGRWPAVAASVAILLLPDAFLQGFGNRYLSYFYLTQINLGMLYGIATAALAWLFVMHGTRQGKLGLILVGYVWLIACLFYKAHLFVANAYLLLLYPCLFMHRFSAMRRCLAWAVGSILFVAVILYSQRMPTIPLIKLDFSGISVYLLQLLSDFDRGVWRDFYTRFFVQEVHSRPLQGIVLIGMLAMGTLGVWLPALALLVGFGRRRLPVAVWAFPLLVLTNYLVMATGLAHDTHAFGTGDELQNRTLVWAYFVIAGWCSAALWQQLWGNDLPSSPKVRISLALCLAALVIWPFMLGKDLQIFASRSGFESYEAFSTIPHCFARSAAYIRLHSKPTDLVQDSRNDPRFKLTALSERQPYVIDSELMLINDEIVERAGQLREALSGDEQQLMSQLRYRGIGWLLWNGEQAGAWTTSVQPVFTCGVYRVIDVRQHTATR